MMTDMDSMTDRNPYGSFRARAVKLPAWQIAFIGAAAAALVVTLAAFATAVFLLVFPAMIALDWFYRWRTRKSRTAARGPGPQETVITTDYEVLPPDPANEERR
jgi:Flp pilus assembly protein TadB